MKFSLFKNDKSTVKDEILLGLIIAAFILLGVLICIFNPSFFIISKSVSFVFGILMIVSGVILLPSLLYRLMTNNTK